MSKRKVCVVLQRTLSWPLLNCRSGLIDYFKVFGKANNE